MHRRSRYLPEPRLPRLPVFIILTDRADGTEWVLTIGNYGGDPAEPRIAISDVLPPRHRATITFPAFGEPHVGGDPRVRLFVRDGHLGMDLDTDGTFPVSGQSSLMLYARRGFERNQFEIILRFEPDRAAGEDDNDDPLITGGWRFGDMIRYTERSA